jgi:hypothetical protein
MMMRDHFVLDDEYDDDMIWWDYLYVYAMITFVCAWYARDYCIKPVQIQNKYAEQKNQKLIKLAVARGLKLAAACT